MNVKKLLFGAIILLIVGVISLVGNRGGNKEIDNAKLTVERLYDNIQASNYSQAAGLFSDSFYSIVPRNTFASMLMKSSRDRGSLNDYEKYVFERSFEGEGTPPSTIVVLEYIVTYSNERMFEHFVLEKEHGSDQYRINEYRVTPYFN